MIRIITIWALLITIILTLSFLLCGFFFCEGLDLCSQNAGEFRVACCARVCRTVRDVEMSTSSSVNLFIFLLESSDRAGGLLEICVP